MARDFNGTDQYLLVSDPASGVLDFGVSSFSISALIKPDNYTNAEACILRKDPDGATRGLYLFRVKQTTGQLEFTYGNTGTTLVSVTGATAVGTSAFAHACAVRDVSGGGNGYVYLNGVQDGTAAGVGGNVNNGNQLSIGGFFRDGGSPQLAAGPYDGKIAELGIWNYALPDSIRAALAKGFSPLFFRQGLVFYSPLVGRNSPESDSMNGNNAVITGATVADHPRIIYPTGPQLMRLAANDAAPSPSTIIAPNNYGLNNIANLNSLNLNHILQR